MRGLSPVAVLLIAVGALFAGCLGDDDGSSGDSGEDDVAATDFLGGLAANVPPFAWDAEAGIDWWEDFSITYSKRDALLPNNDGAANFIEQGLQAAGLETQILFYLPQVGPTPAALPGGIHVVVGMKRGLTEPDRAIALGGHYDTQAATLQGAYDNGAGTAMVFNTCATLAQIPMNRTLLCLFFDGEEEGILGSRAYVADPPADHPVIDWYFGYDMTGINWPGYPEWKLYAWVQAAFGDTLFPFVNGTFHDVLGWPLEGAEAFPFNDRNSDEAAFISARIPAIRFAGGRTAGAYPEYHMPGDTVDFIYDFVGGRDNFRDGFGAIVQVSFQLALMLDDVDLEDLTAEYVGEV